MAVAAAQFAASPCHDTNERLEGATRIGLFAASGGWNNCTLLSTTHIGSEHPAQADVPDSAVRRMFAENA